MTLRTTFFVLLALGLMAVSMGCSRGGRGSGGTGIMLPGPGGGSVEASRPIVGLNASEIATVCGRAVTSLGGERTVMCGPDESTTVSRAECESDLATIPDTCELTVGQFESCASAIGPNPCMPGPTAESTCAPFLQCVFMGTDGPPEG